MRITRVYENIRNKEAKMSTRKGTNKMVHFFQQPEFVVQPQIMCNTCKIR